jgi:hypothetical protein
MILNKTFKNLIKSETTDNILGIFLLIAIITAMTINISNEINEGFSLKNKIHITKNRQYKIQTFLINQKGLFDEKILMKQKLFNSKTNKNTLINYINQTDTLKIINLYKTQRNNLKTLNSLNNSKTKKIPTYLIILTIIFIIIGIFYIIFK